jgi:hypothetical protein
MEQQTKYNFSAITVEQSRAVTPDEKCNGFTAINTGATVATVNGIPLNPGVPGTNNGESFSLGGNFGEIFKGRIDIGFTGGVGQLLLIQKYYL